MRSWIVTDLRSIVDNEIFFHYRPKRIPFLFQDEVEEEEPNQEVGEQRYHPFNQDKMDPR